MNQIITIINLNSPVKTPSPKGRAGEGMIISGK